MNCDFGHIDEPGCKRVCSDCIGEDYLKNFVKLKCVKKQCSYCKNNGTIISLRDLAEYVETAFETHYLRTDNKPDSAQYSATPNQEVDSERKRDGKPIIYAIATAAKICKEISEDVQKLLEKKYSDCDEVTIGEEGKFGSKSYYKKIDPDNREWQELWRSFERTIKTEARFFSGTAVSQLRKLFADINKMTTQQGESLVVDAGPNTDYAELYRARVFQEVGQLKEAMKHPDKELGTPPSKYANSGRMNARGISVFYGATSVDTALAEVRPPVGSHVAVIRFEIVRPIRLLNFTALGEAHESGSVFDPNYANRLGRTKFLRELSEQIARPVMPNDQETAYLSTQAIADFLATDDKAQLDGILFPSVQIDGDGLNIVLFHKASKCKEIDIPKETKFDVKTYTKRADGMLPEFKVIEHVPSNAEISTKEISGCDDREETLAVDLESMTVNQVRGVQITRTEHRVTRSRQK